MIRTAWIYFYAGLLVVGTIFKLNQIKRIIRRNPEKVTEEDIFMTPKSVSRKVIKKTGSTVIVKGKENLPKDAALFVANHQGLFDILAMLGYLDKPIGFIAKQEIKKLPIISTWMELVHCVFIDRTNRRQSMKAINKGIEYLKQGYSMVVFPEGTRGNGREINEFKSGSFRLATKSKVPIVPVTINGTFPILEENGKIQESTISLRIHKPIDVEEYQELKSSELAEKVQHLVEEGMASLNENDETKEKIGV